MSGLANLWSRAVDWLRQWWVGRDVTITTPTHEAPPNLEQRKPTKGEKPEPRWARQAQWVFRRDILDRLDDYCACMRRMRTKNADDYDLFSRVGFALSNDAYIIDRKLSSSERPMFGGLMLMQSDHIAAAVEVARGAKRKADDEEDRRIVPAFIYFLRMERPVRVVTQPDTVTYRVCVVWDERERRWKGRPLWAIGEYHVAVSNDGAVHLLRQAYYEAQTVGRRPRSRATFYSLRWQAPSWLKEFSKEGDAERMAQEFFVMAMETQREAFKGMVIRAQAPDGTKAAFGIDLKRAPYFFSDRDVTAQTSINGRRRPIFHFVREHSRKTRKGAQIVKAHYRGLRAFLWNGYSVGIAWPDANELLLGDGPGAYEDADLRNENVKTIDSPVFAQRLSDWIDAKPDERGWPQ